MQLLGIPSTNDTGSKSNCILKDLFHFPSTKNQYLCSFLHDHRQCVKVPTSVLHFKHISDIDMCKLCVHSTNSTNYINLLSENISPSLISPKITPTLNEHVHKNPISKNSVAFQSRFFFLSLSCTYKFKCQMTTVHM